MREAVVRETEHPKKPQQSHQKCSMTTHKYMELLVEIRQYVPVT